MPALLSTRLALVVTAALLAGLAVAAATSARPVSAGSPPVRAASGSAAGARVTQRWRSVRGAVGYDLVLWRRHRRALDLWPTRARATLPLHWTFRGRRYTLANGPYLWFVYPRIRKSGHVRYGRLVASGTVRGT